ncbi:hypothetical protein [Asticcacaulis sp. AND118]|uniref:hypothetical protein n=1 Tax=Asticcacaulis sp. AND118 TaxID=2840468 RepID=UPI001CFFF777|nr:hypothetical protein [Asticcacaulis sp. AND118]UDF04623.1 hypothetical protein LH365_06180 [Asticcacaulis sp. AND118]
MSSSLAPRLSPLWWGVLCTLPLLAGLTGRAVKNKPWFMDYEAVACGGLTLIRGGNPYDLTPACAGMKPAVFVYSPPVAEALAHILMQVGAEGFRLIYMGLWLTALLALMIYALIHALPEVDIRFKLPVFALLTGGTLASGNIAILLHGLVLAGALVLPRRVTPFILCVCVAAAVKPTLLTYLIVLAYLDKPALWRAVLIAASSAAGLGFSLFLLNHHSPLADQWHATIDQIVLTEQPGIGYFAWIDGLGLEAATPAALALLPVLMIALSVAGLAIAELGHLKSGERLALGLGMAQLLNPRLMDYDLLPLIPLAALIVALGPQIGRGWGTGMGVALTALSATVLGLNLIEQEVILPVPFGVFGLSLMTVTVAGGLCVTRWPLAVTRMKTARQRVMGRLSPLPAAE